MPLIDPVLNVFYVIIGLVTFYFGYRLVLENFNKINRIEGEKLSIREWLACISFGAMFSITAVFAFNLAGGVLFTWHTPRFGGYALVALIIILLIYPCWEMFYLSKPSHDSVHDFHRIIERHILDRISGNYAFLVAFLLFIAIYILPILLISNLTHIDILEISFLWILLIPLFFLSYFAAYAQIGNIIGARFRMIIPNELWGGLKTPKQIKMTKYGNLAWLIFVSLPLILSIFNIFLAFSTLINGRNVEIKAGFSALISIYSTISSGVQGFFIKFWLKKSKTKITDFLFGGYIFIAVGANMLINFIAINKNIVNKVLEVTFGEFQPLIRLKPLMSDYGTLLPLIIIQSLIKVVFAIILLYNPHSEFFADKRLSEVTKAFRLKLDLIIKSGGKKLENKRIEGQVNEKSRLSNIYNTLIPPVVNDKLKSSIPEPIRRGTINTGHKISNAMKSMSHAISSRFRAFLSKKEPESEKTEREEDKATDEKKKSSKLHRLIKKLTKPKKRKYKMQLLYKSVLHPAVYEEYGLDLNETIRKKAAQFLYIIGLEDKKFAEDIVKVLSTAIISKPFETEEQNNIVFKQIAKRYDKINIISKEAIELLGRLGKQYPNMVIKELLELLKNDNPLLKEYVFESLGIIGEKKENVPEVFHKIKDYLIDSALEVRSMAVKATTRMIKNSNYNIKKESEILTALYKILKSNAERPQIIEQILGLFAEISLKISESLKIKEFLPLVEYETNDLENTEFIKQYIINILGVLLYNNLEEFPFRTILNYLEDKSVFIRTASVDALGNFMIASEPKNIPNNLIIKLLDMSLKDHNILVRERCIENITEFIIVKKILDFLLGQKRISFLNFYLDALNSKEERISENASEALKSIAPIYKTNIWNSFITKILEGKDEIIQDLLHIVGIMGTEIPANVDIQLIYDQLRDDNPITRERAVFALSNIFLTREDIHSSTIIDMLDDTDPQVRFQTISSLGKMGKQNPKEIIPILIKGFLDSVKDPDTNNGEIELFAESLGNVGEKYPTGEIIISLHQALMGNVDPYAKDVIAHSLWKIGRGIIKRGTAVRQIQDLSLFNTIEWLDVEKEKEYTVGNIIIILLEALQQKSIPDRIMDVISDAMQDLLPVYTFDQNESEQNEILIVIKKLLGQAYYANYNQEILEIIDRINSLISFRYYFDVQNEELKEMALFYAIHYTPDGKKFFKQGKTFELLAETNPQYLEYAKKSFELSLQIDSYEYFTPECHFELGNILHKEENDQDAREEFKKALKIYMMLDELKSMEMCERKISELENTTQS
ncbi:MAG: hypothetical protein GF364_11680 [Candidatus Lokiarchaeota archaeon]|nr:hypothetical protein [Candidatus Lokiarchaeota archaeon]